MFGRSVYTWPSCGTSLCLVSVVALITSGVATNDDEGLCLIQVSAQPSRVVSPESVHSAAQVSSPHNHKGRLGPVSLLHVLVPYNHIAINVSYAGIQEEIETFPQRKPREFNVMLATFKTFLADSIVQFLEKPSRGTSWSFDFRRSAAFVVFGCLYIGLAQWFLYVTVLTSIFPDALVFANSDWATKLTDTEGQLDMLGQVLVDNFVFNIFIYFPAFYLIKGFLQGDGSVMARAKDAMYKYSLNFRQDNTRSLCVWIPVDFFVFACPMYMRMPLEHGVSFGWVMLMSFTRGAAAPQAKEKEKSPEA